MAEGSRVCPHCGGLNSVGESTCYRCHRRLPSKVRAGVSSLLGELSAPMTTLVLILCVAVFGFCVLDAKRLPIMLFGQSFPNSVIVRWGAFFGPFSEGDLFRYVAAGFVHFDLLHLGFNMFTLVSFGRVLEARVGSSRFVLMFVLASVAGFVVSDYWYSLRGAFAVTAGASAGIFGLIGADLGSMQARRDPMLKDVFIRYAVWAAIWAIMFPVNNAAHLGGCALGFALGHLFERERRPDRRRWLMQPLAGLAIVACVISLVLSNRSPLWQAVRVEEMRQGQW